MHMPSCYLFVFPSIRTTFHLQCIFLLCFTTACFHGENTQYSIATIEHILRIDIFGISFLFPLQAPFHFFLNMGSKVFISVKRVVHSMKLSTTVLLQLPKQHLPSFFSENTQYASTVVPYLKTSFYVIRVWGFLLLKRIIFNYFLGYIV